MLTFDADENDGTLVEGCVVAYIAPEFGEDGDIGVQFSLDTVLNTPDCKTRRPCINGFT